MTECIHCRKGKRTRGLYCERCWLEARTRAAEAAAKAEPGRNGSPGRIHRQPFDDGTCSCKAAYMHYRPPVSVEENQP